MNKKYFIGALLIGLAAMIPFAVSGAPELTQEDINSMVITQNAEIKEIQEKVDELQELLVDLGEAIAEKDVIITQLEGKNQSLEARLKVIEDKLKASSLFMTEEEASKRDRDMEQTGQGYYERYNPDTGEWEPYNP